MTDTEGRSARKARKARNSQKRGEGGGWYRISAKADGPAQILLYDLIGGWGVSAKDFLRDLAAVNGPVDIHIASDGGDVFEAYAIYNGLAGRPGVTTIVDSIAASSASLIAMAGETRLMAKTSQMMIHDAWAGIDGNADDLQHMIGRLESVSGQIAQVYADTAGGSADHWRGLMKAETWFTPEQALEAGLITAIAGTGREPVPASVPAEAAAAAGGRIQAAAAPWDPDGDGDDDSTPEGDTDHSHWAADGKQKKPVPGKPMPGQPPADSAAQAAAVDESAWDASKAWANGASSDDPAAFYAGICAGKKSGDKATQAAWALPYKYHPGDPPNAAGVRNALSRLPQVQGLTNEAEARSVLQGLMKQVSPDYEPADSATSPAPGSEPPAPVSGTAVTVHVHGGMPWPWPAGTPLLPGASGGSAPAPEAATATSSTGPQPHPDGHAAHERKTVTTTTISIEDRAARRIEAEARMTAIGDEHGDAALPEQVQAEWDSLSAELDEHDRVIGEHERVLAARRSRLAAIAARQHGERVNGDAAGYTPPADSGGEGGATGNGQVPPAFRGTPQNRAPGLVTGRADDSIYDLNAVRRDAHTPEDAARRYRDNARRAIERSTFPGSPSRERAQETVERLLARADDEHATLARRILVTGSEAYMRAWSKAMARLGTHGLDPGEIRALSVGTDSAGGYAVPFQLDPTVNLTSNGAINPLRAISRVQQITGKEYDLVTSAGVTVSRSAEGTAMPDNSPTLAQPTIRAERVTGFVPFSMEIDQDWAAMQSEMLMLLADAKDVEESGSFTNGSGTGTNAGGIIATLANASIVAGTGGAGVLAAGDLYALENASAPRFRAEASWMASKTTYNAYRQLFTATASAAGDPWVRPSQGTAAELLGYPAYEDSDMVTTHATNDKVIIFGNFRKGFLIIDRLGMTVEIAQLLFDQATGRPNGQRGLVLFWRNNSRVIIDNAFRLIKVA